MIQIILASHGPMAEAMLASAAMLYGKKENIEALTLSEDDSAEGFRSRMEKLLHKNTGRRGTLILCDIPGGTPCNTAVALAEEYPDIIVIAGMNMVMLLEALICGDETSLEECASLLVTSGKENLQRMTPPKQEEVDLLDSMMEEEE